MKKIYALPHNLRYLIRPCQSWIEGRSITISNNTSQYNNYIVYVMFFSCHQRDNSKEADLPRVRKSYRSLLAQFSQGWKFAHLLFTLHSFTQNHSSLLSPFLCPSLFRKEWLWAIRSHCSLEKSDWAICSRRSLQKSNGSNSLLENC